jgi:hypothetical protein
VTRSDTKFTPVDAGVALAVLAIDNKLLTASPTASAFFGQRIVSPFMMPASSIGTHRSSRDQRI